jgi:hypothetical protein
LLIRFLLAAALDAQGQNSESLFQALHRAVDCNQRPPPPLAYLRLKQIYDDRGQMQEAGYMLLAGAEVHPGTYVLWEELCFLLLRMLSKSCLRVCQTAMRVSLYDSTQVSVALIKRQSSGGQLSSASIGRPQEAIGIFALSDHQSDIGLFWLLRSIHAQLKRQHGSSAGRPRLRTIFWALVARARLLAWDTSIPKSDGFFSTLMSFPPAEIIESVVAFHFLEAGGPSDMILWLMRLHASRCAVSCSFITVVL